jgi:uncharacterized protein YhdP
VPQPNRLVRSFKWLLIFGVLLVALLGAGAAWLMNAPRSMTGLSEAIIAQLQPPNAPFELRVAEVVLDWSNWQDPAQLRLQEITIVSAAYDTHIIIPSGRVALKMLPLLWGELKVAHLQLDGLAAELHLAEQSGYIVNAQGKLFYRFERGGTQGNQLMFPVESLTLNADALVLKDLTRELRLELAQSALKIQQTADDRVAMQLATTLLQGDDRASIQADADLDVTAGAGDVSIAFDAFNLQALCGSAKRCDGLPKLSSLMGGTADVVLEKHAVTNVALKANGGKGVLAFAPRLPEPIALESLELDATLDVAKAALELRKIALKMDSGTIISAQGTAQYPAEKLTIRASANAHMMPVNHLSRYWPAGLAPATRAWATSKIRGGMATYADAIIELDPEDLDTEFLPDDFLKTRIELEDSSVDYLPNFPKAEHVRATVRFTGETMVADIASATALDGTKLDGTKLSMPDLNAGGTPMVAELKLATNPKDVASIMRLLPNEKLKNVAQKFANASGAVAGDVRLGFNAFGDDNAAAGAVNWDALSYDLKAQLSALQNVTLHEAITLDGVTGSIALNGKGMSATLKAHDANSRYDITLNDGPLSWHVKGVSKQDATLVSQDFSGSYRLQKGAPSLTLRGKRLDLSAWMKTDAQSDGFSISTLPPFHADIDLQEVMFSPQQFVRNLKGKIHCASWCESANIAAQLPKDGSVSLRIFRDNDQRKFRLTSDRLGALLRLANPDTKLHEGRIEIAGDYNDAAAGRPLSGRILLQDFYLRNAPIMGRILNAGSLVGLLNALNGDGIRFDKFSSDFLFVDDLLRLKGGKAKGPAMGLLVDGDINLATNMLDVNGNLAPAYVLNSLVGKVPVIGNLLMGGEGESVIAINYSARGNMNDPSVSVNPLSALTPGFTRRFFDVFEGDARDTSAPDKKEVPKDAPKAVSKPTKQEKPEWQLINP